MSLRSELARHGESDVGLSIILAIQLLIIFVVAPLATMQAVSAELGEMLRFGLAATTILIVANRNLARAVVALAFIATLIASLHWRLGGTAAAIALGKIFITLGFDFLVAAIVAYAAFAPGRVTIHRILGAVILYLYVALIFAGIYRVLALTIGGGFSGIPPGQRGQFGGMLTFSLSALTTGDSFGISTQQPFVRSLAGLESVIGQLYPATLLARLVTLHATETAGAASED
ncbi:MAG: hypothetical protein KGK11_05785 [Sphingomonadales bacterium]|nr:hypothetical protein [Sphingomonadales bacterium]